MVYGCAICPISRKDDVKNLGVAGISIALLFIVYVIVIIYSIKQKFILSD